MKEVETRKIVRRLAMALQALTLLLGGSPVAPAHDEGSGRSKRPLTVADAIGTTRIMSTPPIWMMSADGQLRTMGQQDALVSPDGKRYAAMLIRGDLERNGNWMEVIAGRLDSLDAAGRLETVASLFTKSRGSVHGHGASTLTLAHFNPIRWLQDSERVAFLFDDDDGPVQLIAVNVRTHQVERLTNHPADVVGFAAHPDGLLVYAARVPHSEAKSAELLRRGFAVTNPDAYSLIRGEVDGYSITDRSWNTERFLSRATEAPRKITVNARGMDSWIPLFATQFSPDGRLALLDGTPEEVPREWDRYTEGFFTQSIKEARRDRAGFAARQLRQLFVVDLERATSRPLWKVPNAAPTAAWSPDGRSVLLGPTYLPAERADAEGLRGRAVAEVDVATGRFWQIPIPRQFALRGIGRLRWRSDGAIEVDNGEARLNFRKTDGRWQGVALTEEEPAERPAAPVRIELRQDLNTPPALYAVETASGRERMILDLNPRLRTGFTLGRVEHFTWQDEEGRTWSGLLYYPVHHAPGRRFPLVIQTHGHAPPTAFSLYGTGPGSLALGLGPSFSVFAAQPLANRDIAVLQVEDKNIEGVDGSPREPEMYMAAYQAAIERLVAKGLVAREKVGLVGYSRTGWHVEYALTHSPFPYAAAITTDNFDGSYLQALLHWTDEFAEDNGAQPFGEGLKRWLERAPAFNADKLRAPLRLQLESGGLESVLAKWEMFARLRQLQKPVELFIIPDIEHGSHGLQNPAQCLAAQQGAVDWFDFWLNGREDPDLKKAEQYERWRKLRELHEANRRRDS